MENLVSDLNQIPSTWSRPSKIWLMIGGAALVILGLFALYAALATTFISVIAIGGLLLGAGIFQSVISVRSARWTGFAWHILLALLYAGAGILLILRPFSGALDLTLVVGFFFIISGAVRLVSALSERTARWGLAFLSGLITTALGVFVLYQWPSISLFFIGLLVGIDLIFFGNYLFALGFAIAREQRRLEPAHTTLTHASI